MPIRRRAAQSGAVQPDDLEMLGRVFDATMLGEESEEQQENRAADILHFYKSGTTDEDALISLVKAGHRALASL